MNSRDKYRETLNFLTEFVSGEQPTPEKLNNAFALDRQALNKLEGILGPALDNSLNNLSNANLHITNFSRHLGPTHGYQPRMVPGDTYTYSFQLTGTRNDWTLPVWPYTTAAGVLSGPNIVFAGTFADTAGANVFESQVNYTAHMTATGQWCYDHRNNAVYSFSVLASALGTVTCTAMVNIEAFATQGETSLYEENLSYYPFGNAQGNVMPHPYIAAATSVVVEESAAGSTGYYKVTLHPELVNISSPVFSPQGDKFTQAVLDARGTFLKTSFGAAPFFAATSRHNQSLPLSFTALSSDDGIPTNCLFLFKDASTNTYEDLTYIYRDQTSFFARGQTLSTGSDYRVLTFGGNMGESLENLWYGLQHHRHAGPRAIPHQSLSNQGCPPNETIRALLGGGWARAHSRSVIKGNDHPQYLLRNGYTVNQDPGNLENVMMGHLGFGYEALGYDTAYSVMSTDYLGERQGQTFGIYFGDPNAGAQLRCYTDANGYGGLSLNHNYPVLIGNLPSNALSGGKILFSRYPGVISAASPEYTADLALSPWCSYQLAGTALHLALFTSTGCFGAVSGHSAQAIGSNMRFGAGLEVYGVSLTATASDLYCAKLKVMGGVANILATGGTYIDAEMGINLVTRTANLHAGELSNYPCKYIYFNNFVVDMDAKSYKSALPTDLWQTATHLGSPGLATGVKPNLVLDVVADYDTLDSYINIGDDQDAFYFLHLPSDVHLSTVTLDIVGSGDLHTYECALSGNYRRRSSNGFEVGSRDATALGLSTAAGRLGNRYTTYGETSYDVLLRVHNTGGGAMKLYLSNYDYNLCRI